MYEPPKAPPATDPALKSVTTKNVDVATGTETDADIVGSSGPESAPKSPTAQYPQINNRVNWPFDAEEVFKVFILNAINPPDAPIAQNKS